MKGLHLGLGLSGSSAPAINYGTTIANISGGTAATDATAQDYLLSKSAGASDSYDSADWNSAAITGAFNIRCRPNHTTGRYTRLGVSPLQTGRTSVDTNTGSIHLFFDEFNIARIVSANVTIWQNGSGNAEANYTDDEYWWFCRDGSDVLTVLRGGDGTIGTATAVASANTTLAAESSGAHTGTRYFYASIFYHSESCHAKLT